MAQIAKAFTYLAAALLLASCASYDGRGLVPGQSTAGDVEALMGAPAEKAAVAGGDSLWFYPRNPFGLHTFAVRVSPQGTVRSVEQVLTLGNVQKLIPGVTTAKDVRELIGPPWRTNRFPLQQRDVWEYRMYNMIDVEHTLAVQFSADGLVREVLLLRDPRYDQGAGRD